MANNFWIGLVRGVLNAIGIPTRDEHEIVQEFVEQHHHLTASTQQQIDNDTTIHLQPHAFDGNGPSQEDMELILTHGEWILNRISELDSATVSNAVTNDDDNRSS